MKSTPTFAIALALRTYSPGESIAGIDCSTVMPETEPADLIATARKFPSGQNRNNALQLMGRFRVQIAAAPP
jgi:hypothetical protein